MGFCERYKSKWSRSGLAGVAAGSDKWAESQRAGRDSNPGPSVPETGGPSRGVAAARAESCPGGARGTC